MTVKEGIDYILLVVVGAFFVWQALRLLDIPDYLKRIAKASEEIASELRRLNK